MATSRAGVVWRYLPRGKAKHALPADSTSHTGHTSTALCGTAPRWFMPSSEQWWGTGKQSEYDAIETLPECQRCVLLLAPKGESHVADQP